MGKMEFYIGNFTQRRQCYDWNISYKIYIYVEESITQYTSSPIFPCHIKVLCPTKYCQPKFEANLEIFLLLTHETFLHQRIKSFFFCYFIIWKEKKTKIIIYCFERPSALRRPTHHLYNQIVRISYPSIQLVVILSGKKSRTKIYNWGGSDTYFYCFHYRMKRDWCILLNHFHMKLVFEKSENFVWSFFFLICIPFQKSE